VDPNLAPAPGEAVDHHVLARIGADFQATYLATDAVVLDGAQFQTFRVRFQMHNAGTVPITSAPQLEFRPDGAPGFAVVPEKAQLGIPLHLTREWVPSLGLDGGTMQGPLGEDIAVADFKLPSQVGQAAVGHHSMGTNPDAPMTLPAASYTEQEFTVRLAIDAQYLTGYELRITDGGTALAGTQVARIVVGPQPEVQLSPGQRQGARVDDPAAANAEGVVYPLLSPPLDTAATPTTTTAVPAAYSPSAAAFPLATGFLAAATVAVTTDEVSSTDSHSIAAGQCSACHRGHVAKAPDLTKATQQSTLCFSCHDGTGSTKNVKSQYTLARPANDPVKREYFSHEAVDTTTSTTHTRSELDEFGGLSNRHSECADCHNSHNAKSTDSIQAVDGWEASGRLAGVSGVSVVNGAAGSAPAYTFLNGIPTTVQGEYPVTREYQLCFKCHSGFTTLTSNAGLKPSQYALDKGVEFNPANPSYHPVEAAGKNQTTRMAASLAGTSPYKLWNFNIGSTIRCLNCHASGATPATPLPAPGASLPPHTSSNRGILLRNYRDRVLKTSGEAYSAGDFALCYVCHAEAPFRGSSSGATNFGAHSFHINSISGGSGGTDIDTAGAGGGKAICAECHFRIHSTTNKVGAQAVDGTRLVNFAPNVKPNGTTLSWTPGATGGGSCTLTCHGKSHSDEGYSP
jgi:predicted CXXCH cytochrome family protein